MNYDDDWPEQTHEDRRAMVRKTIHPVTVAELKTLGEKRFLVVSDPWCERYNQFLADHPDAKYFMATSLEGAEIIYCRDSARGLWFLPEKGMGVIMPNGVEILAEITADL